MHRSTATCCLALALAGCDHTAPFPPEDYGSSQPFVSSSPRRLTYNLGDDYAPAWLPDGSSIVYTLVRFDTPNHDHCLGIVPASGGMLSRVICDRASGYLDSVTVFEEPAVGPVRQLAYVASRSGKGARAPVRSALVLGTLADPTDVRVLGPIPNMALNGTSYDGVTQVRWLDTRTLVCVAERFDYRSACRSCPLDTLRTGLAVLRLDLSGATPVLRVVPGTMYATSVVAGESGDVIYYTLIGEARIHRRVISSGADSVVHAFGAGIARDVTVVGTRLVAVVGGRVSFTYDSVLGHPLQTDSGGPLYLVDLAGGGETVLSSSLSFRRPMLSPTGKQLVAQATSANLDLWLFDLP